MKLGERIGQLKKKKGMSQLDLAGATGISRDAISKYERGEVVPSVEYAKRIADVFGVSLDYLVGGEEKEDILDKETLERIKSVQQLPDEEKQKIFSVIDALVRDFKAKRTYGLI